MIINNDSQNIKDAPSSIFQEKKKKLFNQNSITQKKTILGQFLIFQKERNLSEQNGFLRKKKNSENQPERFKARLVGLGYSQQKCLVYKETFASVIKKQ